MAQTKQQINIVWMTVSFEAKYSRKGLVKFVENSLWNIWRSVVCFIEATSITLFS